MRAIQPCALLREPVGTGTRSGNGKTKTALGRRVGAKTRRESHLESTESVARERADSRETKTREREGTSADAATPLVRECVI